MWLCPISARTSERQQVTGSCLSLGDVVVAATELTIFCGVARSTAQRAVTAVAGDDLIVRNGHRWRYR